MIEGWGWTPDNVKRHYFIGHRSICGKWSVAGLDELEQRNDEGEYNCTACKNALRNRRANLMVERLKKDGKVIL